MKHYMFFKYYLLLIILFLTAACNEAGVQKTVTHDSAAMGNNSMATDMVSDKKESLRTAMRQLWEDHVVWTRNVIFCIMDGLPGTDQAVKKVIKEPG